MCYFRFPHAVIQNHVTATISYRCFCKGIIANSLCLYNYPRLRKLCTFKSFIVYDSIFISNNNIFF